MLNPAARLCSTSQTVGRPRILKFVVVMAPSRAVAWPDELYNDADVLELDAQGRYIVCRVCAASYAAHGGKKPKPVTMNACFRTCAWDTHKRRTRAHRISRVDRDTLECQSIATYYHSTLRQRAHEVRAGLNAAVQQLYTDLKPPAHCEVSISVLLADFSVDNFWFMQVSSAKAAHPMALSAILNPLDCGEAERAAGHSPAVKRQRTASAVIEKASWSLHDVVWSTTDTQAKQDDTRNPSSVKRQ